MKRYWVSMIVQGESDERAWLLSMYDSVDTIDDAMKTINTYREKNTVLSAWIDVFDDDNIKQTVFHQCYVNVLGHVNKITEKENKSHVVSEEQSTGILR